MTLNCCKFEFSENFTRFGRQHLLSRSKYSYCQRMRCKALNVGYFLDIMFLALICCGFLRYRGPSYTRTAVARFPYLYLGFVVKCLKPKPIKSKTTLLGHILIIAWLDNTLIHNNSVQATTTECYCIMLLIYFHKHESGHVLSFSLHHNY